MSQKKILVFDSHPVQYRVPIWKMLGEKLSDNINVVYATDCTLKGHKDGGFGRAVIWDEPMLEGYNYSILNSENGKPLAGWASLTGKGVAEVIDKYKPDVIFLTGINYQYDMYAYLHACVRKIPVWLRHEAQDHANDRSKAKSFIRSIIFRFAYLKLDKIFYIGQLNKEHYLNHGVDPHRLIPAHYFTVDRFSQLTESEKDGLRNKFRDQAEIEAGSLVVGFSGKFIPKKNPEILFDMLQHLPPELLKRIHFYFLGSGALEEKLKLKAKEAFEELGVKTYFAGFANQSELPGHYLSMDIMVLPSRKSGETWGLVANEAMQSGCSVVVSNAVGCAGDFRDWERFRVFEVGSDKDLSNQIIDLSRQERNYNWASERLKSYSLQSTVNAIINNLNQ